MAIMMSLSAPAMAMGNKPADPGPAAAGGGGVMSTANDLGNNDGVQQAAGDVGAAIAKGGQTLVNQGYEAANNGATNANSQAIIKNGTNIFGAGKTLEYAGKAAPHVGWVATSAGYAAEGQYKGAAVQAVNGAGRTIFVAWAGGKAGALIGSAGGPLGTAAGFILGVGVAYWGGKAWDATIGQGAEALTQKAADMDAQSQFGGIDKEKSEFDGQTVAGETRDITRDNAQQTVRDNIPRPTSGGSSCGGGCTCPPGR